MSKKNENVSDAVTNSAVETNETITVTNAVNGTDTVTEVNAEELETIAAKKLAEQRELTTQLFWSMIGLDAEHTEMLKRAYSVESKPYQKEIEISAKASNITDMEAYYMALAVSAIEKRFVDSEKATVKVYEKAIAKMKSQKLPQFLIDGLTAEKDAIVATFKKTKKKVAEAEAKNALSAKDNVEAAPVPEVTNAVQ